MSYPYRKHPDEEIIVEPDTGFIYVYVATEQTLSIFRESLFNPVGLFPLTGEIAEKVFANVKARMASKAQRARDNRSNNGSS